MNEKKSFPFGLFFEILAVMGLVIQILLIMAAWDILPNLIPIHFDLAGNADASGKKTDLILLSVLNLLFYIGLSWLGRYPEKFNYPWKINENNAERQHDLASNFIKVLKAESAWLFTLISLQIVGISLSYIQSMGYFLILLIIVLSSATIIGYFILALRSQGENP